MVKCQQIQFLLQSQEVDYLVKVFGNEVTKKVDWHRLVREKMNPDRGVLMYFLTEFLVGEKEGAPSSWGSFARSFLPEFLKWKTDREAIGELLDHADPEAVRRCVEAVSDLFLPGPRIPPTYECPRRIMGGNGYCSWIPPRWEEKLKVKKITHALNEIRRCFRTTRECGDSKVLQSRTRFKPLRNQN